MKEEIRRIMRLVQEGKLSPEDAAELIDAFSSSEAEAEESTSGARSNEDAQGSAPPPQPDTTEGSKQGEQRDPFKGFVDFMESVGKEISQAVNWQDVAQQVRQGANKGVDAVKEGIDRVKKGKVHLTWFAAYETREISMPLNIPEGKVLRVENPCGDIVITGGAESDVVNAHLKVRGADEEEARESADLFTLMIEESEHQVLVRQHDVPGIHLDLEISFRGSQPVEVRSMSGDVRVANTGGSCKVQSQSGDLSLRGLDGLIEISSQSGSVRVEDSATPSLTLENKSGDVALSRVKGNVNARTASGDVTLHECSGRTVSVESVSGDVQIDLIEPISGAVSVRTVNGEATIAIPDGSDCRVSLSTLRGDVACDIELEDEARMEQHVTGRLGAGTGSLDVSAVNGNIVMRLRDHASSSAQ